VTRALAFPLFMLAGVALAVVTREPLWCGAAGVIALGARTLAARGAWTPSRALGLANALTLARLALTAALPLAFAALPRLAFVGCIALLLALDGLDGPLARARGEASPFGAALDMESDALMVMLLALILWRAQLTGAWVLIAGLWRYAYAITIALVPRLGEAPRTRFGRAIFVALVACFAGAFVIAPSLLAAIGTTLVSISFVYSLASAASSSRAASDQLRRAKRAA
jgi:phosphatidylglycerophosphate synthase